MYSIRPNHEYVVNKTITNSNRSTSEKRINVAYVLFAVCLSNTCESIFLFPYSRIRSGKRSDEFKPFLFELLKNVQTALLFCFLQQQQQQQKKPFRYKTKTGKLHTQFSLWSLFMHTNTHTQQKQKSIKSIERKMKENYNSTHIYSHVVVLLF